MTPPPTPPSAGADIRPVVAGRRRDPAPWIFGALAVLGAICLFGVLNAQRQAATAPAAFASRAAAGSAISPPPLYIPADLPPPPPPPPPPDALLNPPSVIVAPEARPAPVAPSPRVIVPGPAQTVLVPQPAFAPAEPRRPGGAAIVFDRNGGRAAPVQSLDGPADRDAGAPGADAAGGGAGPSARLTRASRLSSTVPQGALIPAVLETALDSTRPGFVRALVTRDVRGFDGVHVLIPRGTRLFGEYRADLAPGQRRALVRWTRLTRPDGTSIALDSPAADALGRTGVQGRVNSHFLERFGAAVLQSTVNLGVALASRSIGDSAVVVTLPGAAQGAVAAPSGTQIQPTLTVEAGAAVSVFVTSDLVLAPVGGGR